LGKLVITQERVARKNTEFVDIGAERWYFEMDKKVAPVLNASG
jgi:hypothetical protein